MPRVNLAWDLDGEGKNVLRGGFGLFYNRNMGNVEYDQSLHLIPAAYALTTGAGDGFNYTPTARRSVCATTRCRRRRWQPHRRVDDQHVHAELLHVPEDEQLQRFVRSPHHVEPGR